MLYLLDTADVKEIEKCMAVFPISGVTTNPTIVSREKKDFWSLLKDIRSIIGDNMLHVQALGETVDEIKQDAYALQEKIGGNLYIKIPVIPEGYKAIKALKQEGFKITATAIYTPSQALLAANCGADFTAPYVNRIDNISGMGVSVVSMIADLFNIHGLPTKVLAASFKNVQQVHEVSLAGCQSVTVAPEMMWNLAEHPLTDMSVEQFTKDWSNVYGAGSKIYNLK